ncbi:MAG: F0F1 ATP synthase subunit delta [Desulfurococcaceae archaeon]|jgi:V/A-type H+-transporting ATPase subunit E|nr:F0F1 ATP synthase subunit delta [Desulfurococcaceae archaeon]MCC6057527.1 F0F1 ATP synthase subunit delta [Desulfurococcaceae archaeon]
MSVDELKKAVLEKARSEAEAIVKKAEEEAKKVIEGAQFKKKELVEQKKAEIMAMLNPEVRIAEARYRARIMIAEAKNTVLKEIREHVINMINSMPSNKRLDSLTKLVDETMHELLQAIGAVDAIVVKISSKDLQYADYIKNYIEKTYGVKVSDIQVANIIGGLIVECMGGEVVINNSYDERLDRALKTIAPHLLKLSV